MLGSIADLAEGGRDRSAGRAIAARDNSIAARQRAVAVATETDSARHRERAKEKEGRGMARGGNGDERSKEKAREETGGKRERREQGSE